MSPKPAHHAVPRWPVHPPTSDRWLSVAATPDGCPWLAVRREREGNSRITLFSADHPDGPLQSVCEMAHEGVPDRAALGVTADGRIHLVWNEWVRGTWRMVGAEQERPGRNAAFRPPFTIHTSAFGLTPTLAVQGNDPWVAWSECENGVLRIKLAHPGSTGKWDLQTLSGGAGPAFRPTLAAGPDDLLVAWDQYRDNTYEIVWQIRGRDGKLTGQGIVSALHHHRLSPVAGVDLTGAFYLAFQDRWDVVDHQADIHDHSVAVFGMRVSTDGCAGLPNSDRPGPVRIADLNPGLLATTVDPYRSYDGLRRRPQLTVTADNTVWVCFEGRLPGGTEREGQFHAHSLSGPNAGSTAFIPKGGICHAVAPRGTALHPWAVFIPADVNDPSLYRAAPLTGRPEPSNPALSVVRDWVEDRPYDQKSTGAAKATDKETLPLFWFDFHAHSSRSPDAEGDPDELLHYGRDVAGLDGMAVVDNDYYPHKALAEAEWRMENQLADLYTQNGRFIAFPAYEFTYFDQALKPELNHRTIIFRRSGGPLLRCTDPDSRTLADLVTRLSGVEALLVAHHCSWGPGQGDFDSAELCSSWRVGMEETDFVERCLAAGDRFGFMASSDSHRACPGRGGALTGVYAKELTRDAIFEALRARRTIATQGQRIAVSFTAGGLFIGETGPVPSRVPLTLHVAAPGPIDFIEIIRDNITLTRIVNPGCTLTDAWEDRPPLGPHFYRVRIKTEGDPAFNVTSSDRQAYLPFLFTGPYGSNLAKAQGPFAWTTPIWAEVGGCAKDL